MTAEEVGSYIRLLCIQWNSGSIPDDPTLLKRMTGVEVSLHVLHKFCKRGGRLKNRRMEVERQKQNNYRANRSISGAKGANIRWHSHGTAISCAIAQPMANDSSPSPSSVPTKLNRQRGPKKLSEWQKSYADRFEALLAESWVNDAGKWINRIKQEPVKLSRVLAEVESAAKEGRINSTPAQYAEQIWKEFN